MFGSGLARYTRTACNKTQQSYITCTGLCTNVHSQIPATAEDIRILCVHSVYPGPAPARKEGCKSHGSMSKKGRVGTFVWIHTHASKFATQELIMRDTEQGIERGDRSILQVSMCCATSKGSKISDLLLSGRWHLIEWLYLICL